MATHASRRQFVRAAFMRPDVMRPYGAAAADLFERLCDGCGKCAEACPEAIIRQDAKGQAVLDLSRGACTFCGDCITACPTGALREEAQENWNWVARVQSECLSLNAVSCRTCQDFCDENAIRFQLQTGGRARPVIDQTSCTGCGACAAACPAGAIEFARLETSELEATG